MILLDPDLDPDLDPHPAPKATSAMRRSASLPRKASAYHRIPLCAHSCALSRSSPGRRPAARPRHRAAHHRCKPSAASTASSAAWTKPTDVLSFPAEALVQRRKRIAGDLAISVPTARRQGTACGHSLGTELKVLILHGLLHLAGYDHETDTGQMARRERRLRARLGLPQGLIERAESRATQPVRRK